MKFILLNVALASVLALGGPSSAWTKDELIQNTAASSGRNYAAKRRTLQRDAERGDSSAQAHLGVMYWSGIGGPRDPRLAVKWFKPSARAGNVVAQGMLGHAYRSGMGVPRNLKRSNFWFLKAYAQFLPLANNGIAVAQFGIAEFYEHGFGVKKDTALAIAWYRRAAKQGYVKAAIALFRVLQERGASAVSIEAARSMLERAAMKGDRRASFALAMHYLQLAEASGKPAQGRRQLTALAKKGYAPAQYQIAMRSLRSKDVMPPSHTALRLLRAAANGGHYEAIVELGRRLATNTGIVQEQLEAYFWLSLASDAGGKNLKHHISRLEQTLSLAQRRTIKNRVRIWQATRPGLDRIQAWFRR